MRNWGRLLIRTLNERDPSSRILSVTEVRLASREQLPQIFHKRTHEWVYVLQGSALAVLDGRKTVLKKNDYIYLAPEARHSFRSGPQGVRALSLYMPPLDWKGKPDIVKTESVVEGK
jgi:mannose-6-phosphate isomerase-like protein (cupin superfamily)